jgi:hypothetical protein
MPQLVPNNKSGINKLKDNLLGFNKDSSKELKVTNNDLSINGLKLNININIPIKTLILINIYYNFITYF